MLRFFQNIKQIDVKMLKNRTFTQLSHYQIVVGMRQFSQSPGRRFCLQLGLDGRAVRA